MLKMIPIALSLVLTIGAAVATDNSYSEAESSNTINNAVHSKIESGDTQSSAVFQSDGFVTIVR